jgi:hypothetical protein
MKIKELSSLWKKYRTKNTLQESQDLTSLFFYVDEKLVVPICQSLKL